LERSELGAGFKILQRRNQIAVNLVVFLILVIDFLMELSRREAGQLQFHYGAKAIKKLTTREGLMH
jgi:hypothetical protein